ncbi:MAG: LytR C-terminal domain-containing protein [Dermatophilaceae bacterium]
MSAHTTEPPGSVLARERRRRTVVTLGVVLLAMFFAFWYALSYYRADETAQPGGPAASCRPGDPRAVSPDQVTVTVLNATSRAGLAGQTSRQIASRGFAVGKVGNDTSARPAPTVAEVRHGAAGEAQAKLVLATLPAGSTLVKDARTGTDVDVALGAKFNGLTPEPSTRAQPACPEPTG